jgi:hypothetical protein
MKTKHARAALMELEKIRTEELAAAGFPREATAISAARVELDRALAGSSWWHDFWNAPKGQDGYSQI